MRENKKARSVTDDVDGGVVYTIARVTYRVRVYGRHSLRGSSRDVVTCGASRGRPPPTQHLGRKPDADQIWSPLTTASS